MTQNDKNATRLPHFYKKKRHPKEMGSGSLGWARTSDLSVNSRALCQLSYEGRLM
eukprot:COSAG01_NODE_2530_length_7495_cov_76.130206_5_plen_55_part_00